MISLKKILSEATLTEKKSNIELIGPDIDELLDAINFINTGVKTNKGLQPHSFGKNTLKALDTDGHSIGGGKFSIGVQLKKSNKSLYIRQVNELLEDHGYECKLRESVKEAKSDYEVYHKSYTSAIEAARAYAEKKGYEINNDDAFTKIGMGPRKPSEGKTNRFDIELSKDGKVQRKKLQIQVYGMKNSYELNAYIQ